MFELIVFFQWGFLLLHNNFIILCRDIHNHTQYWFDIKTIMMRHKGYQKLKGWKIKNIKVNRKLKIITFAINNGNS